MPSYNILNDQDVILMPAYNILNSQVARWKDDFKIDGIDLDLEEGAGSRKEAGPNMVHFVRFKKSKAKE